MSLSKVHSQGKVPFSWENKPGVSKVMTHQERPADLGHLTKLPPPPCPSDQKARVMVHELQVPLPPCAFQPPLRSLSKRGLRKHDDDPFLTAYKECTKSTKKGKLFGDGKAKKKMFNFSCKNSCSVRDDNLVKISQLPYSLSERERRVVRDGFIER